MRVRCEPTTLQMPRIELPADLGDAHRFDRVGGLAGLRHRDDERARIDHRIAVAKLAREFHLDRQLDQRAQQIHADHAGVIGGAAAGDRDLRDLAQPLVRDPDLVREIDLRSFVDASAQASL